MAEPFKPVPLVAPDGSEWTASTPAELNNLLYGQGYKRKSDVAAPKEPKRATPSVQGPSSNASQGNSAPAEKPASKTD